MSVMRVTGMFAFLCAVLMATATAPAFSEIKRYQVPEENSPVIGPEKADITIIEFIDYQ